MDATLISAEWPSNPHISLAVRELVKRFFVCVNDKSDDGTRLREEVFTPDGIWQNPGRALKGSEIVSSSNNAWSGVEYRTHEVYKVYTCGTGSVAANDLMMFGKATYGLKNGAVVETGFSARCVVDDSTSEEPRLVFFQGWTVCHSTH